MAFQIYDDICDIINKHRERPKIVQYNSIDIDGVEIDPVWLYRHWSIFL